MRCHFSSWISKIANWMNYRSGKTIKDDFLKSRKKQSDKEFLAACELPDNLGCSALKVRVAIANLGGVEAGDIRAEDTFDGELIHFDFWGSLDSIAIVLELEICLGLKIDDVMASQIVDPEAKPRTTVAEFVRCVLRVVYQEAREF